MSRAELLVIACGLSMDAFAVSLCKGLRMRRANLLHGLIIALSFGFFQAIMPLIGWSVGIQVGAFICSISTWVAALLLAAIGAKMLWDTITEEQCCPIDAIDRLHFKELMGLSVATSLDALVVGVSFSLLNVQIVSTSITIGVVTFLLSLTAVAIGNRWGIRLQKKAGITGSVILIAIAVRIVVTSL